MRRKTSKLWAKKDGHTGDPITYRKGEAADLIKPFYQFMISKYSQPVVPVEATTPKFISEQIAKGQAILGLTARGPAYVKDSLRELGEAGYDLKNNPILKDSGHVVLNGTASDPVSVIADGVVFCGKTSKGEVLSTINERYLVNSNIDTVILIDDRLGNVNEFIATVSKAKGIKKVIGVHYKAVKTPHLKDEVATKLIKDVFSEFPVWAEKYSYLLGSTAA